MAATLPSASTAKRASTKPTGKTANPPTPKVESRWPLAVRRMSDRPSLTRIVPWGPGCTSVIGPRSRA
jgi:hypothetical protein